MNREQFLRTILLLPAMTTLHPLKAIHQIIGTNSQSQSQDKDKHNQPMPLLFIGHGSPMNAIEENEFVQGFRDTASRIVKPKAVLCISAHWETPGTFVTAMPNPRTIHDFGGFPKPLYEVTYPAKGDPKLADQIAQQVKGANIGFDHEWGLDHGAWTVLRHFYPNADVPVVQLSLDYKQGPAYHYQLAKELKTLRQQGVLIVGSCNMVHNLRMVAWDKLNTPGFAFDWAIEANEKMKQCILNHHHQELIQYTSQGKAFQAAIPTPEHFLPLLYTLALSGEDEPIRIFNDKAMGGSLTMTSVHIG